jgi:hypothetical protein
MENRKSREHITSVCLSVAHYLGVNKLSADLEIGKHAAVLLAINEGLHELGMMSEEDYSLLNGRYRRKLKDIIAQNQIKRESSHTPVLTLEQQKGKKLLEEKDRMFKGMCAQWTLHKDPKWRQIAFAEAEKFKDELESARQILKLRHKRGDIISQGERDIISLAASKQSGHARTGMGTGTRLEEKEGDFE